MPPTDTLLTVSGLGAYPAAVDLRIPDRAEVRGPSQSGKSTLLTAICAALLDTAPEGPLVEEYVHDAAGRADVTLTLPGGPQVEWSLTRAGTRGIKVDGDRSPNAAAHRAALGLDDLAIARAILVPQNWLVLARSPRARALRDVLTAVLPAVDLRAVVAERCDLRPADPIDLKAAQAAQTSSNRAAAAAEGALAALEGAATPAPVQAPPVDRVEKARAFLARHDAWSRYIAELDRWQRVELARQAAAARVDALGPRPPVDEAALSRARTRCRDARADVERARSELALAGRDLERAQDFVDPAAVDARRALDAAKAAPEHCPTCAQPWPAVDLAALQARAAEATQAELDERARRVGPASARHDAAAAAVAQAGAREVAAHEALDVLEGDARRAAEWDRARAGIPAVDPGPQPTWEGEPLDSRAVEWRKQAEALLDAAARAAGATEAAERAARDRVVGLDRAREAAAAARAEADRVAALVEAIRRAPTEAARRGAEALAVALSGTGLELRFAEPGDDGDEVRVRVDGRPWWLASTGRLVRADVDLRIALRRLAAARYPAVLGRGYGALPVIVDRAQDWSGEWPSDAGVWRLATATGDLRVARVR